MLKDFSNNSLFIDKDKRYKLQLLIVSAVFCLAGGIFSIINFITPENFFLGIVTSAFCVLSLLTFILTLLSKRKRVFIELLFVASALIMFFYFIVWGGAGDRGFSTYWILLLPFLSMMVLGLNSGTICAGIMFLGIVFFLWIPFGRNLLQWDADSTFVVRFPLVYLAAFASSFLFELSKTFTDKYAENLNKQLANSANHDYLTGLTNRLGMAQIIEEKKKNFNSSGMKTASAMLLDIDNFKSANDKYGHAFGDAVLISIANILKEKCGEYAIRFGGDEFVCLFADKSDTELREIAEDIRIRAMRTTFKEHSEYSYTVSIGICSSQVDKHYNFERIIEMADYQSAKAKKEGKNMVYLLSYDEMLGNARGKKKDISLILEKKDNN